MPISANKLKYLIDFESLKKFLVLVVNLLKKFAFYEKFIVLFE